MRLLLLLALFVSVAGGAAGAEPRTVSVIADGYVEAIPDTLQLSLSVKQVGTELDIVQTQVDTITRDVVRIAGELGVEAADIDSSRLSVWPEYEWANNQRHYLGEAVQRDIVLRLHDLGRYGLLVKRLGELPLHRIERPQLSHSTLDELEIAALRVAMGRDRAKASAIASEIGAELGQVLQVSEGSAPAIPQSGPRLMMAEAASDGSPVPSFSFSRQRITATVSVVYSLR
jgi:uncharacterized protein YggE